MPLHPSQVVIGMLTENSPRMLAQAGRLLRSIRWFGGSAAEARVVVATVGQLEREAQAELERWGAEVRVVSRFHPANPTANRLQLIAELLGAPEEVLLILDCDTIVVQDLLPHLQANFFQGKIAPSATVSDEVFERLFAHFDLPKPPRTYVNKLTGTPTIAYVNVGVLAIPTAIARVLAPSWRRFNLALAEQPELVAPCQRHMHQASLALALVETGIPYAELTDAMNYQINAQHVAQPPGFAEIDPLIIHYHHLVDDDGFLLPCPYPAAQQRIETFNERLRAEGFGAVRSQSESQQSQPIVVLGMHRSGTSLVTEVIAALGSHAGGTADHTPPDMFNPTGYWEHRTVVDIDVAMLDALSANWADNLAEVDVARLSPAQHANFLSRAKTVIASLQGRGSFVLKDPRMSLLFPLWREALGTPVCVIAWRDPLAVARSLQTRDGQPLLVALATWEHYTRTLLRDTEGLPRLLISYEELLADPLRSIQRLHADLTRLGVPDLRLPSDERVRQIVNADFNRSGRSARTDETLLDSDQRALLADLSSGDALTKSIAPTPARAFELLAAYSTFDRTEKTLRADIEELDQILGAVFRSGTWKVGHKATALLRLMQRGQAMSAMDRWQGSRRRRLTT
jgi:hypothetical protein